MQNNLRTKAIVLRRTNYGETDRILTVLTPNYGILSVIARGVRREKSRLAGGIELFAICNLNLAKSSRNSSELWTLTGAKIEQSFYSIIEDYDKMQFAYEAIKYISRAAENIDEPEFFELLENAFRALSDTKISRKVTETWFYLNFAKLGGTELNLMTDSNGMKLVEDVRYDFDTWKANWNFRETGRYGSEHIKILRILSNNSPSVATKISDINAYIDDCLSVAKSVAKL